MEESIKNNAKLCLIIGAIAGLSSLSIFNNLGFNLTFLRSAGIMSIFMVLTLSGYFIAYCLRSRIPVIFQFIKFAIIGGMNTMLDLGILNLLIFITGIAAGVYYSVFKSISFSIAVTSSYFWNKYWTFQDFNRPQFREIMKFLFVNIIGFIVNVSIASIVVNVVGAPAGISANVWANIGAVSATIIGLLWNFIGMKLIVFKR